MTFRDIVSICILAFVMIYIGGCAAEKKEILLSYKFPLDKRYAFLYDSKSSVTVSENGSPVYSGEKSHRVSYTRRVMEIIDSSTARLRFSYELMEGEPPGNRLMAEDDMPWNWSTDFVMAANGRIIDLTDDSGLSGESLEYYRKLFEQTTPMYPDAPVTEGYTWSHTVKVLLEEGLTDATTTYKIKSFARESGYDCAIIEYHGNIIIPLAARSPDDSTVTITGRDRIEVEGLSFFAYVEGIVIKEEEKSHLFREGEMSKGGKITAFTIEEKRSYRSRLVTVEQI
jgi:hypothetical protein